MTRDMTKGTPARILLGFAIPMMFGYLLQQFYNLVDAKIVSTYLGTVAFAAVGGAGVISNLVLGFMNGLTQGFSILVSRSFGAKDERQLRRYVASAIILTLTFSVLITAVALPMSNQLLLILNTPDDILPYAREYLVIIIAGTVFSGIYNLAANLLRAVGESKVPLMCLFIAVIVNLFLDIIFIKYFNLGISGAGYATVISQAISGLLCTLYILKAFKYLIPKKEEFIFEQYIYREQSIFGISVAFIGCFVNIGTLIFQSAVNSIGTSIVAGHTAARKIEELLGVPQMCLGLSMTTFASQNMGAGRFDRVKKGVRQGLILITAINLVIILLTYIIGNSAINWLINTDDIKVISTANSYLIINVSCFPILGVLFILRCTLQGMGYKIIPILSSIVELILKILSTIFIVPIFGYTGVIYTEPICWICMDILLIIGYIRSGKEMRRVFNEK